MNYRVLANGRLSGSGTLVSDDAERRVTHCDPIALRDARLVAAAWEKMKRQRSLAGQRIRAGADPLGKSRKLLGVYRFVRSLAFDMMRRQHALSEKQRGVLLKVLGLDEAPAPTVSTIIAPKVLAPPAAPFCEDCGVRHAEGRHIP